MPISSTEIASMNGGYQAMAMDQRSYANMIGQGPGVYGGGGGNLQSGVQSDRMMGSAMSRGAAVGGPLMSGAMGLMGLDPFSIGLKAGAGAFSGGAGIGGALGAGAMAAAPVAIGMAAVGHAGNQMYTGAQQQQALSGTMRSSFNFRNAQGGQGFNNSDSAQIGGMMRGMTEQFGPGGEMTSMRELTQLAGKMGQMGLGQGVRDVQEFGKKFKEMVTALKTMAKDLGTTLEGAMEFANAAKGSGIFGMSNAAKFTSVARSTAVSGGLSVSEVTGAASIGSQIARSVGGLGSQGAGAGMKTIGQIGTATQMGILSESDIYNVTGQTGAEGKQAYAASSLQRSASFLQSGRGRRLLASVAGKDGTLDEDGIQQLMSGGMTIEETMSRDKTQLGKVGRGNFIRNEGRLRGAALEKLGGFLPAIQLQSWAQSKGVDINAMDDRSMLFAQRQLHMGRDEVDQAVKMANAMPQILREQRASAENDKYDQDRAQQAKTMGIEGLKTRFGHAVEAINSPLQRLGANAYSAGSEGLERMMNKWSGQGVQLNSEGADKAYRAAMGGGVLGRKDASTYFGATPERLRGLGGKEVAQESSFDAFRSGASDDHSIFSAESQMSQYMKAGFSFNVEWQGDKDANLNKRLKEIGDQAAATNAPPSADLLAIGKGNAKWMNELYATSLTGVSGQDRIDSFGAALEKNGDPDAKARWGKASPVEKARIMAGAEVGAGIASEARLGANFKPPSNSAMASAKYATEGERHEAYANAVLGMGGKHGAGVGAAIGGAVGGVVGGAVGFLFGGVGAVPGALGGVAVGVAAGGWLGEQMGDKNERTAVGAEMSKDSYKRAVAGVFAKDEKTREDARAAVGKDLQALTGQSGDEINGKRIALQSLLAADEFQKSDGSDKSANEILDKYKELGGAGVKGKKGLQDVLNAQGSIYEQNSREITLTQSKKRKEVGRAEAGAIESSGIASLEGGRVTLSAATMKSVGEIKGGRQLLEAAFGVTAKESALSITDAGAAAEGLNGAMDKGADFHARLATMSVAEKRKLAKIAAGTSAGNEIASSAATEQKIINVQGKRGNLAAAGAGLGVSVSREERKTFGGDEGKEAQFLLDKMGMHDASDDMRRQVQRYVGNVHGKKTGEATNVLGDITGSGEYQDKKKAREMAEAEGKDPVAAAIKATAGKQLEVLLLIAAASKVSASELLKFKDKDPEKHQEIGTNT